MALVSKGKYHFLPLTLIVYFWMIQSMLSTPPTCLLCPVISLSWRKWTPFFLALIRRFIWERGWTVSWLDSNLIATVLPDGSQGFILWIKSVGKRSSVFSIYLLVCRNKPLAIKQLLKTRYWACPLKFTRSFLLVYSNGIWIYVRVMGLFFLKLRNQRKLFLFNRFCGCILSVCTCLWCRHVHHSGFLPLWLTMSINMTGNICWFFVIDIFIVRNLVCSFRRKFYKVCCRQDFKNSRYLSSFK